MASWVIKEAVDAWVKPDVEFGEEMAVYKNQACRRVVFIALCVVAAIVVSGLALTIGDYPIGFIHSYEILWDHIIGNPADHTEDFIIWKVRTPRILTGILAGFGLAVCGAVMQSILKNPLADSYTTGVSSGASFGATLAIALGISIAGAGGYALVANAFVFSLIPVLVIVTVAKMRGASPTTMIMAGIAVMYIFNATTTLIKLSVSDATLSQLFDWSVGSLDNSSWRQVEIMGLFVIAGYVTLQLMGRRLNVLSTGDESAKAMGVDSNSIRTICMLITSLIAASIVSFTGLIGFVGLVCPHIARLIIGSDNRYLIPASAAFGSALLLGSDLVGRMVISPDIIPVGVITSFIGGPLFLWLIIRQKKEVWRRPSSNWKASHADTGPTPS